MARSCEQSMQVKGNWRLRVRLRVPPSCKNRYSSPFMMAASTHINFKKHYLTWIWRPSCWGRRGRSGPRCTVWWSRIPPTGRRWVASAPASWKHAEEEAWKAAPCSGAHWGRCYLSVTAAAMLEALCNLIHCCQIVAHMLLTPRIQVKMWCKHKERGCHGWRWRIIAAMTPAEMRRS